MITKILPFLDTIWTIFGHSGYCLLAFGLLTKHSSTRNVGTNVNQVNAWFFVGILVLIFGLRFLVYYLFQHAYQPNLELEHIYTRFVSNHRIQIIGLPVFLALINPVEGNIMGFIYMPLILLTLLIIFPTIVYRRFN